MAKYLRLSQGHTISTACTETYNFFITKSNNNFKKMWNTRSCVALKLICPITHAVTHWKRGNTYLKHSTTSLSGHSVIKSQQYDSIACWRAGLTQHIASLHWAYCRSNHWAQRLKLTRTPPFSSARTHARTHDQSENTSRRSLSMVIVVVNIKVKKNEKWNSHTKQTIRHFVSGEI